MERLRRALDLARLQRTGNISAVGARTTIADPGAPRLAAAALHLAPMPTPASPVPPGLVDAIDTPGENAAGECGAHGNRAGAAPGFPRLYAPVDRVRLRARHIVFPEDPGPAAHAFRMLRTQLRQRADAQPLRTIGIVSAIDGEGKTLTAVNLALSLAADPDRLVLLADLDLRRPSLASLLGLAPGKGLEAWASGTTDLEDIGCGLIGIERLVVMPTRSSVSGSSELLAGARGRLLLSGLRACAGGGLVLLDLPPALLADDVLALAPALDGVLLVVSERRTRREDFTRMHELLAGVRILGTVLNQSVESERRVY